MVTTSYQANSLEIYLAQLQDFLTKVLAQEVVQRPGYKVFAILHCIYEKPMGEEIFLSVVPVPINSIILIHKSQVADELQALANQFRLWNENLLRLHSFVNLATVSHLELQLAEHNHLVNGSRFVELRKFLAQKVCISNLQNIEWRCFGYYVLSAILTADRPSNPNHT